MERHRTAQKYGLSGVANRPDHGHTYAFRMRFCVVHVCVCVHVCMHTYIQNTDTHLFDENERGEKKTTPTSRKTNYLSPNKSTN